MNGEMVRREGKRIWGWENDESRGNHKNQSQRGRTMNIVNSIWGNCLVTTNPVSLDHGTIDYQHLLVKEDYSDKARTALRAT